MDASVGLAHRGMSHPGMAPAPSALQQQQQHCMAPVPMHPAAAPGSARTRHPPGALAVPQQHTSTVAAITDRKQWWHLEQWAACQVITLLQHLPPRVGLWELDALLQLLVRGCMVSGSGDSAVQYSQ